MEETITVRVYSDAVNYLDIPTDSFNRSPSRDGWIRINNTETGEKYLFGASSVFAIVVLNEPPKWEHN